MTAPKPGPAPPAPSWTQGGAVLVTESPLATVQATWWKAVMIHTRLEAIVRAGRA